MEKMTGGQAAVKALEAEGVSTLFGLIGSATMEMFDALYDARGIRFIGVHDERTGTHMADGYARMSGQAGVILAGQNGPGATNLVTGLAQAKAAYSPVVSLAGALASGHVYRDAFQEVDQQALFKPVTKKVWTATGADRVPEMMREAFREALAPRRGPVQLNLPRDVLSGQAEFGAFQTPGQYRPFAAPAGAPEAIDRAAAMLAKAARPVIIAGGGIKNTGAAEPCLALAEAAGCPVVTSPGHGDAVPFGHPLNAGQMGPRGNVVASRLVKEADVILALGTRIGFNSTFYSYDNINERAEIIQVEMEPTAIGRYFPVSLGIHGDAPTVAGQLTAALAKMDARTKAEAWTEAFKAERSAYLQTRDAEADVDSTPLQPSGLFKTLRDVLPKDAAITMDAGTLCLQATDALNYWQPKSLFTPLDFGLVGFSFACGLGVKLAAPDRPVVSLMGDGGFGMTVSELSTAVDHGINTVTVVMNNCCWGAEKAYQRDFFGERYIGADVSSPPFDKLAELYGAKGYRADTLPQLAEAVEDALQCGKPAVIDTMVDPSALYSFRRDSFKHRGG
ncbi:thiamine pyrophosphate-binding protein [Roseovarius indicus]|uniref:Sulfoacetaldehyde acetyltransferase n=1 Tax=Roseovarius indicus TaxID=540747 RepID=A0A0T5P9N6_9RHOB|nr:thiamine pyrophosphate-binding protein [Roseovarius indicus]KRS17891.1 sulfoacetaldehyde acetyltransferase [Roseovarius indicus]QEW27299.1 Sulfoacetaldehyde acetyltransferase [Roseovarius indicus]SFD50661.1 acetolactate synthase, large subunit [Roseovarius indicus]